MFLTGPYSPILPFIPTEFLQSHKVLLFLLLNPWRKGDSFLYWLYRLLIKPCSVLKTAVNSQWCGSEDLSEELKIPSEAKNDSGFLSECCGCPYPTLPLWHLLSSGNSENRRHWILCHKKCIVNMKKELYRQQYGLITVLNSWLWEFLEWWFTKKKNSYQCQGQTSTVRLFYIHLEGQCSPRRRDYALITVKPWSFTTV